MKRFKFRLAKVRSLRHQEEKVARRALGQALAGVERCDQQLAKIEALAGQCAGAGDSSELAARMARGLQRGFELARTRAQQGRKVAEQQLDVARTAYTQRRAAAKAIDNLRERAFAAWRAQVAAGERDEAEELARLSRDSAARSRAKQNQSVPGTEEQGS